MQIRGLIKHILLVLISCIYFYFFCDVLGFRSSRILSTFLLISLFTLSLTLLFLLMILMAHSLIALILSSFKCFRKQLFFSVLWKNNLTLSTRQNLLNVPRHADSSIATLQMILLSFSVLYTHVADLQKCCSSLETFLHCLILNLASSRYAKIMLRLCEPTRNFTLSGRICLAIVENCELSWGFLKITM